MEFLEKNSFITKFLLENNLISEMALDQGLRIAAEKGGDLIQILISINALNEKAYLTKLSSLLEIDFAERLDVENINLELLRSLPITHAKQVLMLPLKRENSSVVVAVANPLDFRALDDFRVILGAPVEMLAVPGDVIFEGINRVYDRMSGLEGTAGEILADDDLGSIAHEIEETMQDILDVTDEAPIIRLLNSILAQAVKEKASDIHVEPFEKFLSLRFRKDGILREILRPPKRFQAAVTSRVKIMGNLNIAEKRLPQDGRIRRIVAGKEIDIRLSTVPTTFGERIVMRILDRSSVLLNLTDLGLGEGNLKIMEKLIQMPYGIILVTGPTGSGKTTTLYAALSEINTPDKNILTIEDPVEYQLQGIGQMQVNPKIDFTFANGLRSILRQDPDVVLVGEIRDRETAEIAVQASLTGHLVFSTLHTNDAASAFTRLIDMGVEPFLIASSVLAMMAQRLVRVLCRHCRVPYIPTETELKNLGISHSEPSDTFYRAHGCEHCLNTGYSGRKAIYEILQVEDLIRELVMKNVDSNSIKRAAVEKCRMKTLRDDGADKVRKGITTAEEVMRVTQQEEV
jgi:general secretion pathway protein E